MKNALKTIVAVMVLAVALIGFGQSAFAETTVDKTAVAETTIADYVKTFGNVKNAVCLTVGENCIVAIQPDGILLKSDFRAKMREIEDGVLAKFPKLRRVFVTDSARVFYVIEKIDTLSKTEKQKVVDDLFEQMERPHKTLPKHWRDVPQKSDEKTKTK